MGERSFFVPATLRRGDVHQACAYRRRRPAVWLQREGRLQRLRIVPDVRGDGLGHGGGRQEPGGGEAPAQMREVREEGGEGDGVGAGMSAWCLSP